MQGFILFSLKKIFLFFEGHQSYLAVLNSNQIQLAIKKKKIEESGLVFDLKEKNI